MAKFWPFFYYQDLAAPPTTGTGEPATVISQSGWRLPWPALQAQAQQFFVIDPKLLTLPEEVDEPKWHQPLSEPRWDRVRSRALVARIASGNVLVSAAPFPERVDEPKWHQPLSEPRRDRVVARGVVARVASGNALVSAAPFPETITESRWHQPLSEPRWDRVRNRGAIVRAAASGPATDPKLLTLPEQVTASRWFAPFREPVGSKMGMVPY